MDKMCVVILDKDYCALEQYMFTLAIDTNNQIPATCKREDSSMYVQMDDARFV